MVTSTTKSGLDLMWSRRDADEAILFIDQDEDGQLDLAVLVSVNIRSALAVIPAEESVAYGLLEAQGLEGNPHRAQTDLHLLAFRAVRPGEELPVSGAAN